MSLLSPRSHAYPSCSRSIALFHLSLPSSSNYDLCKPHERGKQRQNCSRPRHAKKGLASICCKPNVVSVLIDNIRIRNWRAKGHTCICAMALAHRLFTNFVLRSRSSSKIFWFSFITYDRNVFFKLYIIISKNLSNAFVKNVFTKIFIVLCVISLCATWFFFNNSQSRIDKDNFKNKRILSTRFFDFDKVKDYNLLYSHMLFTTKKFVVTIKNIEIKKNNTIIIYVIEDLKLFNVFRVE